MKILRLVNSGIEFVIKKIVFIFMAFLALMLFVQVVMRYGFGVGIKWADESIVTAFLWAMTFGMALGVRRRTHISVDLLKNSSPGVVIALEWLAHICAFFFYGMLLYFGFQFAKFGGVLKTSVLRIRYTWQYASIPVSALIAILFQIEQVSETIQKMKKKDRGTV